MNLRNLQAFASEMSSISEFNKEAGIRRNLQLTVRAFSTPVKSMGRGVQVMKTDWNKGGFIGKGLMAAGTAASVGEAVKKDDPAGQGRSRTERVGTVAGDVAGGLIGAPFGISGGMLGQEVGRAVGSRAGRVAAGIHRMVRPKKVENNTSVPGKNVSSHE